MGEEPRCAWSHEESVVVKVSPAEVFRYWTTVRNWADDAGVESAEIDGPFQRGARGRTHLAGGGHTDWTVISVEGERAAELEAPLEGAALRFELRFEDDDAGGCRLTQRIRLLGEAAANYLEAVRAGFGPPDLSDGMRALARRIEAAIDRGQDLEEDSR